MSNYIAPMVLQVLGVAVVLAEFVLPSAGVLTVIALGLFGYSLYLVFATVSVQAGMYFVIADVVLAPVLVLVGVKLMAASPVTLRNALTHASDALSQPEEYAGYLNREGTALTDLHPGGKVALGEEKIDVVSHGEYIEKGTAVRVCKVDSNRIVVCKMDS